MLSWDQPPNNADSLLGQLCCRVCSLSLSFFVCVCLCGIVSLLLRSRICFFSRHSGRAAGARALHPPHRTHHPRSPPDPASLPHAPPQSLPPAAGRRPKILNIFRLPLFHSFMHNKVSATPDTCVVTGPSPFARRNRVSPSVTRCRKTSICCIDRREERLYFIVQHTAIRDYTYMPESTTATGTTLARPPSSHVSHFFVVHIVVGVRWPAPFHSSRRPVLCPRPHRPPGFHLQRYLLNFYHG